ncbi:MAG: hypothetical protein H7A40_00425 [Chlamydiales bacterium]|nr:hypothetical protein [Chlamydiales bacterium]
MNKSMTMGKAKHIEELKEVIAKAIKKVGGTKENDLCKFIPMEEGYMHHFTLKKMKHKEPTELCSLIEKFIIRADKIKPVPPKQRAARGSRKRRDQVAFSRTQLERMLNMARLAGDKEMIALLSPKESLASVKRKLIQSIRQNDIEHELWNTYVEVITAQETMIDMVRRGESPQ